MQWKGVLGNTKDRTISKESDSIPDPTEPTLAKPTATSKQSTSITPPNTKLIKSNSMISSLSYNSVYQNSLTGQSLNSPSSNNAKVGSILVANHMNLLAAICQCSIATENLSQTAAAIIKFLQGCGPIVCENFVLRCLKMKLRIHCKYQAKNLCCSSNKQGLICTLFGLLMCSAE